MPQRHPHLHVGPPPTLAVSSRLTDVREASASCGPDTWSPSLLYLETHRSAEPLIIESYTQARPRTPHPPAEWSGDVPRSARTLRRPLDPELVYQIYTR